MTNKTIYGPKPSRGAQGFSLIELMISITLGLFLLIGMTALLVNTSTTRKEMEKGGRQIENGRYATQLLIDDIRHAGFYGDFGDRTAMPLPASVPNPCSTILTDMRSALFVAVQGYEAPTAFPCSVADNNFAGTGATPLSDMLVIRRAETSAPITTTNAAVNGTDIFLQTTPKAWILDKVAANFTLHQKDDIKKPLALLRKYLTHIYFLSSCSECSPSDGIPTLKRLELSGGVITKIVPLVEGIENIQYEYGLDTDGDGDPDNYSTATGLTAAQWASVVSIRLYLLARNIDTTTGWDDSQNTYCLGADTTCPTAIKFTPASGDRYKRRVYTAVVRLNNPSGRKEL